MVKRFRFYDKELTPEQENYILEEGMENHRSAKKSGEERKKK